jgi:hypothetical protein
MFLFILVYLVMNSGHRPLLSPLSLLFPLYYKRIKLNKSPWVHTAPSSDTSAHLNTIKLNLVLQTFQVLYVFLKL